MEGEKHLDETRRKFTEIAPKIDKTHRQLNKMDVRQKDPRKMDELAYELARVCLCDVTTP